MSCHDVLFAEHLDAERRTKDVSKQRSTGLGIALVIFLAACSSSTGGGVDVDAGDKGEGASDSGDANAAPDGGPASGAGTGTISGAVNGASFTNVATSYVLGAPDDAATTVVYLFSKPVACSDLAAPGWDTRIANGTQFVELKMFGTTPATYKVVTTLTPAPGEASVNYTLSATSGTPAEQSGGGGTITLKDVKPTTSASGSFALVFGASHLDGTFESAFCAGGHEP